MQKQKSWFKFRLRSLLIVVTICAFGFGTWGNKLYRDHREKQAVEKIEEAGGKFEKVQDRVVRVYLGGVVWGNDEIKELVPYLQNLPRLRELDLVRAGITDEGIRPLSRLQYLDELYVFETGLTGKGIEELRELLPNTQIKTDEPDPIASKMAAAIIYPHAIVSLAWSPDGKWLATGSGDGFVRLWDVEENDPFAAWKAHTKWAFAVAFSPDGNTIATGGADRVARLWDLDTQKLTGEFIGHINDIHSIAFTPAGDRLITASDDRSIRIWDVDRKETISVLTGHQAQIPGLDISSDGRLIASASRDETVRVWQIETGKTLAVLNSDSGDQLAVAFEPNGQRLAAASQNGDVRIWDLENFELLNTIVGDGDPVYGLAFDESSGNLATAGRNDVSVWNPATGLRLATQDQKLVSRVAFQPNGNLLASSNAAGEIRLYNPITLATQKVLRSMYGQRGLSFPE